MSESINEDLLLKIFSSFLLVHYYNQEDGLENFDEIHKDEKTGYLHKKLINSTEEGLFNRRDSNLYKDYSYNNSTSNTKLQISSEVLKTKTIENNIYKLYRSNGVEGTKSINNNKEVEKVADIDVLIAMLKIPVSINKIVNLKNDKIYKIESINCNVKKISGNLLLLNKTEDQAKVKLFYEGVIRIEVKVLCIDHVNKAVLYCNTKDLVFYSDFNGTINTYIENRFVEDISSVNIPIKIDLVSNEFSVRTILEEPVTIFDLEEEYYKSLAVIGNIDSEITLLSKRYADI
ncbi:hypothetical protein [Clostridium folliculivorans]|uniref:Uncharacterized protein n=1 Tax=Clostridium folliculivorans TaxID=2886038 RepID=A0A9W5Y6P7_9CLOT|nr:hypothetical protein [Clostridium folliculivorans]GKU27387.1 hypothetical protein CFOLD11_42140 [Clostridium folliculivorans]GKU32238.1 hypothetical protein CFB3_43460 [Clostridium folliculivorans]